MHSAHAHYYAKKNVKIMWENQKKNVILHCDLNLGNVSGHAIRLMMVIKGVQSHRVGEK